MIKPRWDDDGVPWCDAECPQADLDKVELEIYCALDEWNIHEQKPARGDAERYFPEVCPHAVRRMAVELHAWRCAHGREGRGVMDGFLERLREPPSPKEIKNGIDPETTKIWHDICCEAADEIEQLRAKLAAAEKVMGSINKEGE